MNLAKLSVFALVVFFLAVSPAAAQVGVDSGLWEFCDGSAIEPALVVVQGQQTGATGSGCIVTGNPQPEILTAAHVVDSDSSFTVSFHSGEVIRGATVRARDNEADVALLQCATPEGCSVLEVAGEATEGEDVKVCGFGGGQGLRCFKSKIAAVADKSLIAFTYAIPGDSGGPIVNSAGKVVGVVSGGSVWAKRKVKTVAGTVHSLTAPVRAGTCTAINRLRRR